MNRLLKPKASIVHETFGEETIIVNLDTGNYYSAQRVSSNIWQLVTEGLSESDILQRITADFSGDKAEISTATTDFLNQLVEETLVDVDDAAEARQHNGVASNPHQVFAIPLLQKFTDMEEMLLLDPIHEIDEHGWPNARKMPG